MSKQPNEDLAPERFVFARMIGLDLVDYTTYEIYPKYRSATLKEFKDYVIKLCWPILKGQQLWEELSGFVPVVIDLDNHSWEAKIPKPPGPEEEITLLANSLRPTSRPENPLMDTVLGKASKRDLIKGLRTSLGDLSKSLRGKKDFTGRSKTDSVSIPR